VIIVGLSYIIISPVIKIVSNTFTSVQDAYNPLVYLVPIHPTLDNIKMAFEKMDYFNTMLYTIRYVLVTMVLQTFICSLVGYGFARFQFLRKECAVCRRYPYHSSAGAHHHGAAIYAVQVF
jgi:ABC-type glycerol-3-phosphate transport system permease component